MERKLCLGHFLQELYVNFSWFGKTFVCVYTYTCKIALSVHMSVDTEVVTIFCNLTVLHTLLT